MRTPRACGSHFTAELERRPSGYGECSEQPLFCFVGTESHNQTNRSVRLRLYATVTMLLSFHCKAAYSAIRWHKTLADSIAACMGPIDSAICAISNSNLKTVFKILRQKFLFISRFYYLLAHKCLDSMIPLLLESRSQGTVIPI